MKTVFRPLTDKQKAELNSSVSWRLYAGAGVLVICLFSLIGALFLAIQTALARHFPSISHPSCWLVPTIVVTIVACLVCRRWWAGRPAFQKHIKGDLASGQVAVHCIEAVDAIEVQEKSDEGPTFFIKTVDGETIVFTGQYLHRYAKRGFPWTSFEIMESPSSKIFFGLRKTGDRLKPSFVRKPFTWEEWKSFRKRYSEHFIIEADFEGLKRNPAGADAKKVA